MNNQKKKKEKILIADDMYTFLRLEKMLLEHSGYEIIMAKSGTEALKKTQSEKPSLVFLDLVMPDMSGDAVCRFIKTNKSLQHIPVIMVTTRSDEESVERCRQAGCDDYLTKPITKKDLFEKIEKFLKIERRKHPRAPLRVRASCIEGERIYQKYTLNISEGGIFIETDDPFPLATELEMNIPLPLPEPSMTVKGMVVRTVPKKEADESHPPGMGVKFLNLKPEDAKKIRKYIEST